MPMALDAVSTDWLRIVALYDELMAIHPSPVVGLNRAIAVGMSDGPLAGLSALERVAAELPDFHLVAAARAELLAGRGDRRRLEQSSIERSSLAPSEPERRQLARRRAQLDHP